MPAPMTVPGRPNVVHLHRVMFDIPCVSCYLIIRFSRRGPTTQAAPTAGIADTEHIGGARPFQSYPFFSRIMKPITALASLACALAMLVMLDSCGSKETEKTFYITGPTIHDTTVVHDTTSECPVMLNWTTGSSGVSSTLLDAFMVDASTIFAVGDGGTILRTTDGGSSWGTRSSSTTATLYAVRFADASTGIAVGDDGVVVRTTDGGTSWTQIALESGAQLRNAQFVGPAVGYIVGTDPGGTVAKVFKTMDAGMTWTKILDNPSVAGLYGVHFLTSDLGTVTGKQGVILRTTDGGSSWTPQPSGVTGQLIDVFFTDPQNGTIVGGNSDQDVTTILHTTNGGASWAPQPANTKAFLYRVHFSDAEHGITVGYHGTVLQTSNGGASWMQQYFPYQGRLIGMSFYTDSAGVIVGDGGQVFTARPY
jgi:photosystem II stability/assembly factor-like uncharacterized protein